MIEPYVSERQCRTCRLCKLVTEFSEGRNDCKQCRRDRARAGPRTMTIPEREQRALATTQVMWRYPVAHACNLRGVL